MLDEEAGSAPVRETAANAKTSDVLVEAERQKSRPMRLAGRQKANAGIIAGLRSRMKEIEGVLDAEAKAIADAAIEKLRKSASKRREALEAEKAAYENAVSDILQKAPVKGFFGFGYKAKREEWDELLREAKSDAAWAGRDLEEHDKALQAAISQAAENSKEAARAKNTEAVRELEAIAEEIDELNGDVNGIRDAARALLRNDALRRFGSLRFPDKSGVYEGEILGVAEYSGYAVLLQDGPLEYIGTEGKDVYGRTERLADRTVWMHGIRPEQAPVFEPLTGHDAAVEVNGGEELKPEGVRIKEQTRGHGFHR
jgi:uncharacterized protein (UPF0335 family)